MNRREDFVIEVINFYVAGEQKRIERLQADCALSPLERLRCHFQNRIATHGHRYRLADCLLSNLNLEVAGHNISIPEPLRQSFDDWEKSIAMTIRESIDKGELSRTANAKVLAAIIVDSWEGAQVRANTEQSDKALNLFYNYTFNVLLRAERQS
jgi:TetR/AcrR family transcriptional regulator, transcriptional repressor for nem operon